MKLIIVLLIMASLVDVVFSKSNGRTRTGFSAGNTTEALVKADPEYARGFLNSFNSFCPTNGTWTTNALSASREIEKVLVDVRDDPNCADVANSIAVHTTNLTHALQRIEQTSIERDILSKQRNQSDILMLLDTETNPSRIAELEALFRSNQLALSLEEGSLQYDQDKAKNYYLTNVMVDSASQLFQQASLNQMCLLKSPTLLSSLASIGSSFAAAMVTGGASLGFAAASNVLGYVFEFMRKSQINKDIQKLGQVEFITAYQCVLEAVSNQWCQANEANELIEIKMRNTSVSPDPFTEGVRLLNRDLPIVVNWLNSVRSATDPQNSSIADRQIKFKAGEALLDAWKLSSIGALGDVRDSLPKIKNDTNDEKQFRLLQGAINAMLTKVYESISNPSSPQNPVLSVASLTELPWKIAGIDISSVPPADPSIPNIPASFSSFTPSTFLKAFPTDYPLDPFKISNGISELYESAQVLISEQRNNVLNADPEVLFWDAETPQNLGNIRGVTPINAIDTILAFFQNYFWKHTRVTALGASVKKDNDPYCPELDMTQARSNKERIFIQTVSILCNVKENIQDFAGDTNARLQDIFKQTKLESGTTFIEGRIQKTLRVILTNLLIDPNTDVLPLQAKLIVVEDIIEELTQYSKSNLTTLKFDIQNALQISEMTLQNFAEIFSEGIEKTFVQVYNRSINNPNSKQLLAKYCSLLLTIPDWSKREVGNIDYSLCNGLSLTSEWQGNEFEQRFSESLFHSKFDANRACYMRRYLRKEKFYQTYNKKALNRELLITPDNI